MTLDLFFETLKSKTIDILFPLTQQTEARLAKYNLTPNSVNIETIAESRTSKILVIDFTSTSFFELIDNLTVISKFYRKIIIVGFQVNPPETLAYSKALSRLSKNYLIEARDIDSYNISQACGSHMTILSANPILYTNNSDDVDIHGKVSVICACMNRNDILKINIMSWLNFSEIGEIVIVDWNSKQPLYDLLDLDDRIKIIRVEDQQYFNISQAFNLALDHSTLEYVLKLDTDYFLNPYYNFFKSHPIKNNCFYSGSWSYVESDKPKPIFQHLSGLCYVRRDEIVAIGGYNEHFSGYGYDDSDLHNRLIISGKQRILLNQNYSVMHIPHSVIHRTANYEPNSWNDKKNKEISLTMGLVPDRVKSWNITKSYTPNLYFAHEISNDIQ